MAKVLAPAFQLSTHSPNTKCKTRIPTIGIQSITAEKRDIFSGDASDDTIVDAVGTDMAGEQATRTTSDDLLRKT